MTDRRYSIIPARAVCDQRLEGRDLQVLCFLGMHTDKLGWCFLRQGMVADHLGCSRSTVQRSLDRLIEAGWVQTREFAGRRPHACHAYRVVMDTDDLSLDPPEYPVGASETGERCPPVGTSRPEVHHPRAPVPMHARAPRPPEVPTHAWAHNDQDSGRSSSSGSARARDCAISEEAHGLADEIATIAGHDPQFLPPKWMSYGHASRVQMMLDHGWQPQMMREQARAIMTGKRDGPPHTIKYFEAAFARAHAEQSAPAPLPTVVVDHPKQEHHNARKVAASSDWQRSKDKFRTALGRLGDAVEDDAASAESSEARAHVVRLATAAGRGRS